MKNLVEWWADKNTESQTPKVEIEVEISAEPEKKDDSIFPVVLKALTVSNLIVHTLQSSLSEESINTDLLKEKISSYTAMLDKIMEGL